MTRSLAHILAAVALAFSIAGSARAVPLMVGGWDFSQYYSTGGFLSIDNMTLTNTLPANYSNLDASFGMGPDSGVYGTMFMNGQFGSTNVTPTGMGNEPFLPTLGSLTANLDAPVNLPLGLPFQFESLDILQDQGQLNRTDAKMTAFGDVSVVFCVSTAVNGCTDPLAMGLPGTDWTLSFAGLTTSESPTGTQIDIQFSGDGVTYGPSQTVTLGANQAALSVDLAPGASDRMWMKFIFQASDEASIDGVAVSADVIPEPGAALLLATGLAGLAAFRRRCA
jgi:hypothetical protein